MNITKKQFVRKEELLDCNDKSSQTKSLLSHNISDTDMSLLIDNWSAVPKVYTGDEITKQINAVGTSCNYHISFGDVNFALNSNDDINFMVVPGPVKSDTDYSILLFKGLVSQVQALIYQFFKGQNQDGSSIICFKTVDGADLELCWNVSNMPTSGG